MKKIKFYAICLVAILFACDKDDAEDVKPTVGTATLLSKENINISTQDEILFSFFSEIESIAFINPNDGSSNGRVLQCIETKIENIDLVKKVINYSITINPKDCTGNQVYLLGGKISFKANGYGNEKNDNVEITYENFKIKVENFGTFNINGTINIKNIATTSPYYAKQEINRNISIDVALEGGTNQKYTHTAALIQTIPNLDTKEFTISGTSTSKLDINTFTITFDAATPLVLKPACLFQNKMLKVSGIGHILFNNHKGIIDYGNGECDLEYTLKSEDGTLSKVITLK